jgi:iron complex transport system substrate-binding protein
MKRPKEKGERQTVVPVFCFPPLQFSAVLPACLLVFCLLFSGCGVRKPAPAVAAGRPRIVSLSPNVTEMICAVGAADCLVGRSKVCDYPAEAMKDVPVVGDFCSPSLEKLVTVRPTLVLEVDAADATTNRRLTELGIPVRNIVCARLDDIPRALREIGTCTGHVAEAERLAAEFEAELARLRREQPPPEARPLTFVEIWSDPLMTAGRTSFIAELVRLAGGCNAGDTLEREYAHVSAEWLVACDPGVVLCLNDAPTSHDPLPVWRRRNGMSGLRAVKSGRVYGNFDLNVMLKPGPRVLQAVAELRRVLQPPPASARRRASPGG